MAISRNLLPRKKEIRIHNKEHTEARVMGIHAQAYQGKARKPLRNLTDIKRLVKELPRR